MNYQQTAQILLEFLYQQRDYNPQFFTGAPNQGFLRLAEDKQVPTDNHTIKEAFWYLVHQGLAAPGDRSGNQGGLPWVAITDYGIQCFEEGRMSAYDPDEFINSVQEETGELDDVVRIYIEEANGCFLSGRYLASVVMTGCALEKTIINLTNTISSRITDATLKTAFEGTVINNNRIKTKFDNLVTFTENNGLKNTLSQSKKEQFDTLFKNIFSHIRIVRNEAGHPTGREVKREEALANLLLLKVVLIYIHKDFIDNINIP